MVVVCWYLIVAMTIFQMSAEHVICVILFQSVLQQANSLISPDKNGFGSDQEIGSENKIIR